MEQFYGQRFRTRIGNDLPMGGGRKSGRGKEDEEEDDEGESEGVVSKPSTLIMRMNLQKTYQLIKTLTLT